MIDFEQPMIKEFRGTFGRSVIVQGCQVHLFRNWRKTFGEVGNLITWSCHQATFSQFNKCLHGLCYVPIDALQTYYRDMIDNQLEKVLTELDENENLSYDEKDNCKESLRTYLDYLERNYIGRQVRNGYSKARFEPEIWNQISNCLEGRPLSTNRNEGFHSRMRHDLPMNNTLWALLAYLVNLEAETRVIRDEDRGVVNANEDADSPPPGSGGGSAYKRWRMRTNLKNLISHRDEYGLYEYLCRISHIEPW